MDLLAEGPEPRQRWRMALAPERPYVLGREHDGPLVVPWDGHISREHVRLVLRDEVVHVERLPAAKNPLFFHGAPVEACAVHRGEHFVLGNTSFSLRGDEPGAATPDAPPLGEFAFSRESLQRIRFLDADRRIEVLSHLPDVIAGSRSDTEAYIRVVNLLLAGVARAEAVALVAAERDDVAVLHWDRRQETSGGFKPSRALVREAVQSRRQSVLHVWHGRTTQNAEYTASGDQDWAFCTPVIGPATPGWALYVAGRRARPFDLRASLETAEAELQTDVKFAELVAEIVSAIWRLRQLERAQAGLRQFFSPAVLATIGEQLDTRLLAPREADVTILFCDLRGFSRQAEESRDDLLGLLDRVSQALGLMTGQILAHGGGIGDFLGDAALGFWGWPVESPDAPLDACRAALGIRGAFASLLGRPHHPLANFQVGIGIAQGRAVAGKIGTSDHVKVTVFGPVVNLASRLESMTRRLRVPILLDETVARAVRERLPREEGRVRQLARILPYGMDQPLTVSELVPPLAELPELTDAHLEIYEQAVSHFIAGQWEAAHEALHHVPAGDRAQDFLALEIAQHNRIPPPGWDGVIRLASK